MIVTFGVQDIFGGPQLIPCSWAYREHIPYVRAVRYVPRAMKDKLPATYLMALDTHASDESRALCLGIELTGLGYPQSR